MATNPFSATVGLKGVTSPEPAVLVNDLAGISTELVSALSNADATSSALVWAKIQRNALDKLRNIIEGELTKSADFAYISSRSGDLIGEASDVVIAPSPVYAGYQLRIPVKSNDELYFLKLSLESLSDDDVETTIKAFSATGEELLSKAVTVSPGYNELKIESGVASRFGLDSIVFIGIDTTNLSLLTIGTGQAWDCATSLTPATLVIAEGHALAFWETTETTGVKLEAVVRRSLLDVIARYADRLLWAYAYVCGSLLMAEKLGSSNVNLFTNTNRTFTEDREAKFMDEAIVLAKPVARDMLKELAKVNAVVDKAERPFDPGYYSAGFV